MEGPAAKMRRGFRVARALLALGFALFVAAAYLASTPPMTESLELTMVVLMALIIGYWSLVDGHKSIWSSASVEVDGEGFTCPERSFGRACRGLRGRYIPFSSVSAAEIRESAALELDENRAILIRPKSGRKFWIRERGNREAFRAIAVRFGLGIAATNRGRVSSTHRGEHGGQPGGPGRGISIDGSKRS